VVKRSQQKSSGPMPVDQTRRTVDGLTLKAYRGDGSALLAFDLDEHFRDDLAGFAVECVPPNGAAYPLLNRLNFSQQVTTATTPAQRRWTPTDRAPLQTFRWVHFPKDVTPGAFTYRATAILFAKNSETKLEPGPQVEVSLELMDEGFARFDVGFTRGYLSSQAYADRFDNAPYEPKNAPLLFPSAPFERRWNWLGFHARRLIFDFLQEAIDDPGLRLDVFAYDLDEPDVVRDLKKLGPRLRLFLDNSKGHIKGGSPELEARALLAKSAGADNIKVGKFQRFAHDKVLIQRRGDTPVKVLSGSANFSIRGLYVQSNNVFVFDDPDTAALYQQAFEQAWTDPSGFKKSPIAAEWFERRTTGLPPFYVSFAPHKTPEISLQRVAEAIKNAKSSVLFAIMEVARGTGVVLDEIRKLPQREELYAFGTTQRASGSLTVTASGRPQTFIPFSYLQKKVPEPFRAEASGGAGQVIHHKFVVVDFNDAAPVVFAGSSNLAAGGETENGDNLLAFYDRNIAGTYAVEAIRLIDHYRFRAAMKTATSSKPLHLKQRSEHWPDDFYDPKNARSQERLLFVR
jgi:phosphatidylserine/phosphatidylglycerophosphate/cardiolipin synthase-like enzyme